MKSLKQHISLFHKRWGFFIAPKRCSYFSVKNLSKPVVLICENSHCANDCWHEETTRGHACPALGVFSAFTGKPPNG